MVSAGSDADAGHVSLEWVERYGAGLHPTDSQPREQNHRRRRRVRLDSCRPEKTFREP